VAGRQREKENPLVEGKERKKERERGGGNPLSERRSVCVCLLQLWQNRGPSCDDRERRQIVSKLLGFYKKTTVKEAFAGMKPFRNRCTTNSDLQKHITNQNIRERSAFLENFE